jgi:hypothetical protein
MRKEEKAKLVGLVELGVGSGKTATALLFDNMRWILDFSEPSIPYEVGCTVTFIEEDEGDLLATAQAEQMGFGRSSINKLN